MAEVSETVLDALADTYQQSLGRIQIAAETAATDAWFAHNSFNSDEDEDWEATFLLILAAAALATQSLVASYYQAQRDYMGIAPRVVTPDVIPELAEDFAEFGASPPTRARYLWEGGVAPPEAIRQSATRVSKLSSVSVRAAEQRALADLFDDFTLDVVWEFTEERPDQILTPQTNAQVAQAAAALKGTYPMKRKGQMKWKRVPQVGACGWCVAQSSRLLSDATHERGEGWHAFCRCGWRMVTSSEAGNWSPLSSQRFQALLPQRSKTVT